MCRGRVYEKPVHSFQLNCELKTVLKKKKKKLLLKFNPMYLPPDVEAST